MFLSFFELILFNTVTSVKFLVFFNSKQTLLKIMLIKLLPHNLFLVLLKNFKEISLYIIFSTFNLDFLFLNFVIAFTFPYLLFIFSNK